MIKTKILADGITLRCFYDDRFKQGALGFQMLRPMCAEEASLNPLVSSVLLRGSEKHPDIRSISRRTDDLYGLSVASLVRRVGDYQAVGLGMGLMDDRFALPGDQILAPAVEFMGELLLEPALENGVFRADYVDSEKKNLISALNASRNDKAVYAMGELLRSMGREDTLGIPRLGRPEWVAAATPQTLFDHYRKILRESPIDIFYVGSASADRVARLLQPVIDRLDRDCRPIAPQTGFHDAGGAQLQEQMDVAQAKLCMGYVTPITNQSADFDAMQVMNTIFGAGMTAKLFVHVREKLSLCYSIGTSYNGIKGIVTLSAGINTADEEKAKAEIAVQLDAICRGDITDEEMAAAKEAIISGLRGTHDSPGAIEGYYSTSLLSGLNRTPEEYMSRIAAVTREQVAAAARTLRLHTTYILRGTDNGTN